MFGSRNSFTLGWLARIHVTSSFRLLLLPVEEVSLGTVSSGMADIPNNRNKKFIYALIVLLIECLRIIYPQEHCGIRLYFTWG